MRNFSHFYKTFIAVLILLIGNYTYSQCVYQQTGTWTLGSTSAFSAAGPVNVTITSVAKTGTNTATVYEANDNMGTSFPSFWNPSTISGDASLALRHTWDTTPEGGTSPASNNAGVRTYSITFSQPIKEFRLHIDRLGGYGFSGGGSSNISNSSRWTLTSNNATISRLSGNTQFVLSGSSFYRQPDVYLGTSTPSTESNTGTGTAAGTLLFSSTTAFTTLTFDVSGVGVEGDGIDVAEFVFEACSTTVQADDDAFAATATQGISGATLGNVLTNDNYNGGADGSATTSNVNISVTTPATPAYGGAPVPSINTATGAVTLPANTPAGSYTIVYRICSISNPSSCDTATITVTVPLDSDGDGVPDWQDLDDDNDGILDTAELYCDTTTAPNVTYPATNSPAAAPLYAKQLLFFDWSGVTLSPTSPSATKSVVYNGVTYTATISNYTSVGTGTPNAMVGNDILTWIGPSQMVGRYYNVNSTTFKEALYIPSTGFTGVNSFNISVTASKDGVAYPVDFVFFDAETTNKSATQTEQIKFTNNTAGTIELLEKTGTGTIGATTNGVVNITGIGTNTVTLNETETSNVNALLLDLSCALIVLVKSSSF